MYTVDTVFIMQVVCCCETGRADVTDRLPLFNAGADSDIGRVLRHMRIQGRDIATMLQDHGIAIAVLDASKDHFAITRCHDGGTLWRRVIHAAMRPNGIENRVPTSWIETGADAREIDGCPDKSLADTMAVGREVVGMIVAVDIANGLELAAVIIEFRRNDFTVGNEFTVLPNFLIEDVVIVAPTNVEDEINIPGKNARQVHDELVAQAGFGAAQEE